ncbi:unnamed protein product [Calicophoron daubneyi]|uniref:BPTI/Kunitz inhibitor domain-containing protein n=1 Tax=Calicophoron daubneyi TaxID=300641 RepID=A0AAV2T9H3_CALDB
MYPSNLVIVVFVVILVSQGLISSGIRHACTLPLDPGPCTGYFLDYGFDPVRGRCIPFVYGGCGGNHNRFEDLKQCERSCAV